VENKLSKSKEDTVITDCRFANEVSGIKRAGGMTIRVSRGPNPAWFNAAVAFNKGPDNPLYAASKAVLEKLNIHASEYSSVGLDYDHYIDNNSTIDALHQSISIIL